MKTIEIVVSATGETTVTTKGFAGAACQEASKFIEQALFNWLMTTENPGGATLLRVNYKKTDRNTPAGNVLKKLGFTPSDAGGLELDTGENPLTCTFIEVRPREPVSNT